MQNIFRDDANVIIIRNLFRILAAGLAGMHAWAAISSQSMNSDGISYLDIGDAYLRGDWQLAVNPVWPPLYSWLLGLVNALVKPPVAWEFPLVHLVNFTIFLWALACFEALWGKLQSEVRARSEMAALPAWAWWSIGCSLFIWAALNLIQIWAVTPDMLMAGLLFLAAGQMVEIRGGSRRWKPFLLLGLYLGLGYLAKTFMLSVGLVMLALCPMLAARESRPKAKTAAAAAVFLLVSLPYILLISEKQGRLTIGEAGTVTYTRYVMGIPFPHWQGDPDRQITLDHPSRQVLDSPPVYEFAGPIGGTYPIATNPAYWYEGIKIRPDAAGLAGRVAGSAVLILNLLLHQQGLLLAMAVVLYRMAGWQKKPVLSILRNWALVIPALAALGLYSLVLVEERYIAAFLVLFWADVLANIRIAKQPVSQAVYRGASILAVLGLLWNVFAFNVEGITRLDRAAQPPASGPAPARALEVAAALQSLHILPGDPVGVIGYGFDSFWARLARVQIAAELPELQAQDFWLAKDGVQARVLTAFARTGVRAVVAENAPGHARLGDGWRQVGDSSYFIYVLNEP